MTLGEKELRLLDDLGKIGVKPDEQNMLKRMMESGVQTVDEQVRLLKKYRFGLLEDIHRRQQDLDKLDYIIHTIRQTAKENGPRKP